MKIFQTIQMQCAFMGISSSSQSNQKYPNDKRVIHGFLLYGCCVVSHVVYIYLVADGFMEYMQGISSLSANIITFNCLAAIVFRNTLLFNSIDNLEELIDTRSKYPASAAFFSKTNQQVERLSQISFTVVMKMALQFVILPVCVGSFVTYFSTDLGPDSFQLPFPIWFPFEWKNPVGYLIAIILEYVLFGYAYYVIAIVLALTIAAYWFLISVTKEIQRILHSINKKAQARRNHTNKLKVLFAEFIDTHGAIKQVAHNFSDIFQPMILSLFTWSLLGISAAMLIIQMEILHHENIMPLLLLILNGIFGLATVFTDCEFGQRLNDAFGKTDCTIAKFDWYSFPIEIQRLLPMVIANAQQPVELKCFGSIACTREVFKNVIHRAFSYYMVLCRIRQIDSFVLN